MGRETRKDKALVQGRKSGQRRKMSAYGRMKMNGEGLVKRGKEWTQIQGECLWWDTEEERRKLS